ncbi:RNA polymerase sigma factor SigJ [Mesorhizobium sp. VK25A]|uniref:RNA polymerase sigma factor SigJ n=1 Tax=Mesorhizobium vachelliae TaxID=3072309 RepID=A0ABU5A354_9HYPH|nr:MULTISPECIES: RNA polymerase sigma factor SigJ [unclassified Mesorhizobium]MDX8532114.1 RNA polymerase sigma factor SigJ [Mesorhizobium sp. VK25D]MDX8543443.1 RNA polymerase sigma factor SigJ [Mesorhizobium sp. VK25A]
MPEHQSDGGERLQAYLGQRKRLIRLAYRYLGSVGEAEDIVQDAWLRFAGADSIEDAPRLLSRIVTNLSLDRLRSAQKRRETYVGPWLPEPFVEQAASADIETSDAALDISFSVMRALERLSPLERAALFLHDLYDVPFEEVAETLKRSPAACRQMASRARKMLRKDNRRFPANETDIARYVAGFEQAMTSGDIEPLKRLLAEDVEFIADGGGKVAAALNILVGRDRVAKFLVGAARKNPDPEHTAIRPALINGGPGLVVSVAGAVVQTFSFALDAEGSIAAVYTVRNPDKLAGIGEPR